MTTRFEFQIVEIRISLQKRMSHGSVSIDLYQKAYETPHLRISASPHCGGKHPFLQWDQYKS